MTAGIGIKESNAHEAIDNQYARGIFDEYLEPVILTGADGQLSLPFSNSDVVTPS